MCILPKPSQVRHRHTRTHTPHTHTHAHTHVGASFTQCAFHPNLVTHANPNSDKYYTDTHRLRIQMCNTNIIIAIFAS